MSLNMREIAIVKGMLERGDRQHDIAAYFGVNAGRIAEVKTGARGSEVAASHPSLLPPPGPYLAGRSALHARDALLAIREQIDAALAQIEQFENIEGVPGDRDAA